MIVTELVIVFKERMKHEANANNFTPLHGRCDFRIRTGRAG